MKRILIIATSTMIFASIGYVVSVIGNTDLALSISIATIAGFLVGISSQ